MPEPGGAPRGLLIDWGGVLTTNVFVSFQAFCAREGLPTDRVRDLFRSDPAAHELLVGLEEGRLSEDGFQSGVGALLGVDPAGLIARLMAGTRPDTEMLAAVRRARHHGIVTGLVSNSWGRGTYDAYELETLFDGVIISGTVGIRKPAPEIYEMGARAIRLAPADCVYVDDLPGNLKPARALGMTTLHHTGAATTITELSRLFGVNLGRPRPVHSDGLS